jgi:hypothetical protein
VYLPAVCGWSVRRWRAITALVWERSCDRHRDTINLQEVYEPDIRHFYKMFFLCRRVDAEPTKPSSEIIDAAFFARDGLRNYRGGVSSRVTSKLPLYFMRIRNDQSSLIDCNAGT